MRGVINNQLRQVLAALPCCIALTIPAWAAPPSTKPTLGAAQSHALHLDLRPPTVHEGAFSGDSPTSFGNRGRLNGASDSRLASLAANVTQGREISPLEAFARRVHREGLPVARLWESHSALVSLGLNSRGKPGLWLVQKTH